MNGMPDERYSASVQKVEDWLEQVMDQYGNRLTNFAYSYVKDWGRAQEVVQDVFVTCFRKSNELDEIRSLEAWLYRITSNRCKDVLRSTWFKRVTVENHIFQFLRSHEPEPLEQSLQNSRDDQLAAHVLALPVKYREVIVLYYYEELSVPEISERIGVNENTLRTRLKRGREKLAQYLESGDPNEKEY